MRIGAVFYFGLILIQVSIGKTVAASFSLSAGDGVCPIVIASNAPPSERYAAEELQRYLELITSLKLPITDDSTRPSPYEILLGDNAHLRKLALGMRSDELGPEGF